MLFIESTEVQEPKDSVSHCVEKWQRCSLTPASASVTHT